MLQLLLVLYRPSPTNTLCSIYTYLRFLCPHPLITTPNSCATITRIYVPIQYIKFLSPHISLPRLTHDIAICICLRFLFPHCLTSTPNPCTIIPIYHDISDFYVLITSVPHPTQMLLPHITIIPQILMSSPPRFHTQLKCYITHM